jgi:hypothetical protein
MDGRGILVPVRIQSAQVRTVKKRSGEPNQLAKHTIDIARRAL